MLSLVLIIGSLLLTYFIIRKGVHHGILDADATRRADERARRLKDAVREGGGAPDPQGDPE